MKENSAITVRKAFHHAKCGDSGSLTTGHSMSTCCVKAARTGTKDWHYRTFIRISLSCWFKICTLFFKYIILFSFKYTVHMCDCTSNLCFVVMMNKRRFAFCCTQYKLLCYIIPVCFVFSQTLVNVCEKLCHSRPIEGALCSWDRRASHFLPVEEGVCQSPSLRGRPPSKVSARPPH